MFGSTYIDLLFDLLGHFRINILDVEEKYGKIWGCRTFNYFKTVSGRRTFSHFIAGTSATLTTCVTILNCCFAWTTTLTTLSSASSSPRAGNFNWPLVLFNKDGKLQWKKLLCEWKRGGSTFSPSSEYIRKEFRVPLRQQTIHKSLLPRNLLNQWIHLIPYPD